MNPTGTEARVCADIAARQALGLKKYGVSVENNKLPLIGWLRHAYHETLDKAVYLRRAIEDIEGVPGANQELCGPPKTLVLHDPYFPPPDKPVGPHAPAVFVAPAVVLDAADHQRRQHGLQT